MMSRVGVRTLLSRIITNQYYRLVKKPAYRLAKSSFNELWYNAIFHDVMFQSSISKVSYTPTYYKYGCTVSYSIVNTCKYVVVAKYKYNIKIKPIQGQTHQFDIRVILTGVSIPNHMVLKLPISTQQFIQCDVSPQSFIEIADEIIAQV